MSLTKDRRKEKRRKFALYRALRIFSVVCFVAPVGVRAQTSCVFLDQSDRHRVSINQLLGTRAPVSPSEDDRAAPALLQQPSVHKSSILSLSNLAPDFPNINVTQDSFDAQNEPSIAVNPRDPNAIVIGANDYRSDKVLWSYSSTDGGLTWLQQALPGYTKLATATDPAVQYDGIGNIYYSNGRADGGGFPAPLNEVVCYRSTDAGQNWSDPEIIEQDTIVPAKSLSDKFFLAIDRVPQSPYFGRIYVTWADIANNFSRIAEAYSTDGGSSWSQKVYVSPSNGLYQCPIPACEPNGELLVTYIDLDSNSTGIVLGRSNDGGATFGNQSTIATLHNLGPLVPNNANGHPTIKNLLRVNSFPAIAIDLALHKGRAYVTWCAKGNDNRDHVYLASSDDNGNSWSRPLAIENDSSPVPTDKFFPWIAVDETNGDVGVDFYDSRNDPQDTLIDVYMSLSTDGGSTFTTRRISSASFDPTIRLLTAGTLLFFGDYIGLASVGRHWYPTWTDSRSGVDQDIYLSVVRPYAPSAVTNLHSLDSQAIANLSWQYSGLTTFGMPMNAYHFEVTRSDGNFKDSIAGTSRSLLDRTVVPGSSYTYSVQVVDDAGDTSTAVQVEYSRNSAVERMLSKQALVVDLAPTPNPVQSEGAQSIRISLLKPSRTEVTLFNSLGQTVDVVTSSRMLAAGSYRLELPARTAGVYWLSVAAEHDGTVERVVRKSVVF